MTQLLQAWNGLTLIKRILIGLALGLLLGLVLPQLTFIGLLGDMFVGGLKAIAPLLVFVLVANALSKHSEGKTTNIKTILKLYMFSTFMAAVMAVVASYLFPVTLKLTTSATELTPPEGVAEVFRSILLSTVDNPINAIASANYIGVLVWACLFGFAMRAASEQSKDLLHTMADVTSQIVSWIINLAPFGIMGLVYKTIAENGIDVLADYGYLLLVLVGTMLFQALVTNPLIAGLVMKKNPYPLALRCLQTSGVTAFFTRSSAANIPVNMKLCQDLGLDEDTYAISIPLGATINMDGAAITINILTLAAAHTLGVRVDFPSAILLAILTTLAAAGASGVAGGSLLLIPVACSLFGIPNDIAMQVVGVGFIVGVVQDSCETALNSSTDVLYTAAAEWSGWKKK